MKIFKNRGDIYLSKSRTGADREQHILLGILAAVLLVSVVDVVYVGAKNDFSAKKFFAPDQTVICNLLPQTTAEGSTLAGVYNSGGINSLVQMTETATGIKPDFYIVMTVTDFASFFDDLGEVNYPLAADVKYRNTTAADPFSLRISAGEASLNGKRFTALWRYFLEEKDLKSANDLGLAALNMLFSADNGTEKDELFRNFVTLARTNLTVRDFSGRSDNIKVLTGTKNGVNAYNVEPEYNGNALTARDKSTIQGYFSK